MLNKNVRCFKQHVRKLAKGSFEELLEMCKHSNSLYNCSLYTIKEYYKQTTKYIGYNNLYKELKDNDHYKALPSKISQQILRLTDKNYRSFFALLKRKRNGEYGDKINEPRFKKSGGLFNLILPNDQVSLKNGLLKITKDIKIPFTYDAGKKIKQVVIIPKLNGKYFEINISYEEEREENIKTEKSNLLSIDLGLDNLATCYSNVGHDFIINGKPLKAYNQFYNKRKAKIKSNLKKYNNKNYSLKLEKIDINRNNWVRNYINQSVSLIKKEIIIQKISKVVIGYNEGWKQEINIGKRSNQNFTNIPHHQFKEKLKNKLEEIGVEVIFHEESYTSKCSALDKEEIKKHESYKGKRIKRGLFESSNGSLINADINGAINIMRKVFPDEIVFSKGIERCIVHPIVLNIFNQ